MPSVSLRMQAARALRKNAARAMREGDDKAAQADILRALHIESMITEEPTDPVTERQRRLAERKYR